MIVRISLAWKVVDKRTTRRNPLARVMHLRVILISLTARISLYVFLENLKHYIWFRLSDKVKNLYGILFLLLDDIKVRKLVCRMNIVPHLFEDVEQFLF